ncbi:DUF4153 domain-containing protein, partial [Streptomyces sp. CBMA123]|uniref:DUF4153 domain-containing protein n=1 Tax=Streptomyces sp. CBMA123 TaxID=1896313 RepID=UPI00294FFB02
MRFHFAQSAASPWAGAAPGVVAAALGRMWFYVDASGLTRLRLWVLVVEIWLGVVFLLLITAGLTR